MFLINLSVITLIHISRTTPLFEHNIYIILYTYILSYILVEKNIFQDCRTLFLISIIGCPILGHLGLIGEYQVASCTDDEVYSIEQTIFQKFYAAVFLDK